MFKFFFVIPAKAGHEVKLFSAIQRLNHFRHSGSSLCCARNDEPFIVPNDKNLNIEYKQKES
jgi:hypothetical protein